MKNKVLIVFASLLFLGGLGALLYPTVKTAAFQAQERQSIRQFEQYRSAPVQPETAEPDPMPAEKAKPFPELWEACVRFNEDLNKTHQAEFTAERLEQASLNPADYGWESEVFATLSIPTVQIEAPLYLGASTANLYRGAAILGQTSMPIGGKNTHCVIAGHRTWSATVRFLRLEEVQPGDLIYLTNPWETLAYRVIGVKTIPPDSLELVTIQPGRDLLSIFTCTYPSTRRVLVTCERIDKEEEHESNY